MTTGLEEMRRDVERFPAAVTANLRQVAQDTAYRMASRSRGLVARGPDPRTHGGRHTQDSIVVIPNVEQKEFRVEVGTGVTPKNLPRWIEFGTRFMAARPFMRPAADAEVGRYRQDMIRAVDAAAETLK